jgi:hypothetical protein
VTGNRDDRRFPLPAAIVAALGVASIIATFALAPSRELNHFDLGPSSRSIASVGFAGLLETLSRTGHEVARLNPNSPDPSPERLVIRAGVMKVDSDDGRLRGQKILIILPKFLPILPDFGRRGWAGPLLPVELEEIDDCLAAAGFPSLGLKRLGSAGELVTNRVGVAPAPSADDFVQLMTDRRIEPLVAYEGGVLLGRLPTSDDGAEILVLSDPGAADNAGMSRRGNPAFSLSMIDLLTRETKSSGPIVFHDPRESIPDSPPDDFASALFDFPMILVTILIVVSAAAAMLAFSPRFGGTRTDAAPTAFGKTLLVRNSAALLIRAGHWRSALDGYLETTFRRAGRSTHAPASLSEKRLLDWLEAIGKSRGLRVSPRDLLAEAAEAARDPRGKGAVAVAMAAYEWKLELEYGPRTRLRPGRGRQG